MASSNSWFDRVKNSPFLDQQMPAALLKPEARKRKKKKRKRKRRKLETVEQAITRNVFLPADQVRLATSEISKLSRPSLQSFHLPSLKYSASDSILARSEVVRGEVMIPQKNRSVPMSSRAFAKKLRKDYARNLESLSSKNKVDVKINRNAGEISAAMSHLSDRKCILFGGFGCSKHQSELGGRGGWKSITDASQIYSGSRLLSKSREMIERSEGELIDNC